MSSAGYAQANGRMYWRMYSGHNCTNYAAYRMIQNGMSSERPWSGGGNATYWGAYMINITNQTPTVGAVAWWRAGVYPAGSSGHVAYVERVVSPTEIIISQDAWGGDFSWARVTKSGSGWPSGFIHFNDVKMKVTEKPAITGEPKVDSVLRATPGTWKPGSVTTTYQWRMGGDDIAGATESTLTVTKSMIDKRIKVRVTASKSGYATRTAGSEPTGKVLPGVLKARTAPTLGGEPRVDETLTADAGDWSPTPRRLRYQWLADGEPMEGAIDPTLTATPALVGKAMSVRVTARRPGYTPVSVTTAASEPVARGVLEADGSPEVTGDLRPGEKLRVTVPTVSPDASRVLQWTRDGEPIADATGKVYELTNTDLGHRVRARLEWTRSGYTTLVQLTEQPDLVRTLPDLDVDLERGEGRLVIRATVSAAGLDTVPAVVRVRAHGDLVAEKTLKNGTAVLRLTDEKAGTRRYRVVALGTDVTERVAVERVVTIL